MSIKSYKQVLIYDLERKEKNKKKYIQIYRAFSFYNMRAIFFKKNLKLRETKNKKKIIFKEENKKQVHFCTDLNLKSP